MSTTSQTQKFYEQMDAEHFRDFMRDQVSAMASSVSLSQQEALEILKNIRVEMVGELRVAVKQLEGQRKGYHQVDSEKLSAEIQKLIAAVSEATSLDTQEITDVFTKQPGASLEDLSSRMHERSKEHRFVKS